MNYLKGPMGKKSLPLYIAQYAGLGEEAATALKSIEIAFRDNYERKSNLIGKKLLAKLSELKQKSSIIKDFSGSGALWAIEVEPIKIPTLHQSHYMIIDLRRS